MAANDDARDVLRFPPPPEDADPAEWDRAERESLKFPRRFLKKAQELRQCRQESQQQLQSAWEEKERLARQLYGFVMPNLIAIVDNCKLALAAAAGLLPAAESLPRPDEATEAGPGQGEGREPPGSTPRLAGDSGATLQEVSLGSIHRSILYLLEELGAVRIELVGHTYDDVIVDGEKIEDPFVVLEATQKGKQTEVRVREVVEDLWVTRRHGRVEVLRRGTVLC
jgi:hypothetical protein